MVRRDGGAEYARMTEPGQTTVQFDGSAVLPLEADAVRLGHVLEVVAVHPESDPSLEGQRLYVAGVGGGTYAVGRVLALVRLERVARERA